MDLSGDALKINNLNKLMANVPIRRLENFLIGEITPIIRLRKVATQFGGAIILDSEQFSTFLPSKLNRMSLIELDGFNEIENLNMIYQGKVGKTHMITFQQGEKIDIANSSEYFVEGFYAETT